MIYKFLKGFTNRWKTNRVVVFNSRPFPNILKYRDHSLENKTLSDTYWRVQLVCVKVQAYSSLEPSLEYNQD